MIFQRKIVNDKNCDNWSCKVRYVFIYAGFAEIWMYPESVNTNVFLHVFSLRL